MKPIGIVRQLDDLGRIVIPKEIRRVIGIREGDPLEIYSNDDNSITLRKFKKITPVKELENFLNEYSNSLDITVQHLIEAAITLSKTNKKNE